MTPEELDNSNRMASAYQPTGLKTFDWMYEHPMNNEELISVNQSSCRLSGLHKTELGYYLATGNIDIHPDQNTGSLV